MALRSAPEASELFLDLVLHCRCSRPNFSHSIIVDGGHRAWWIWSFMYCVLVYKFSALSFNLIRKGHLLSLKVKIRVQTNNIIIVIQWERQKKEEKIKALSAITDGATLPASAVILGSALALYQRLCVSWTAWLNEMFTLSVCLLGHWGQLHLPGSQGQPVLTLGSQTLLKRMLG